jgi:hypothetical protein
VHKVTPQVRQMIPTGEVAVLFCAVDYFCGFDDNYVQNYAMYRILHRQHVPCHMVHLLLLERSLKERPVKTLIVPWVRCLRDSQAATLRDFVSAGGRIVFIGDECGTYTWEGVKRKRSAFADILPEMDSQRITTRDVGKGRTAFVPGAMALGSSGDVEWHEKLQEALFAVAGATPSVVRPDSYPSLLVSMTRNCDNSMFWAQLVNYDVNINALHLDSESYGKDVVRSLEDVRVVIPLPEGVRAGSVTLFRPGEEDMELSPEHGLEGCAVTVPRVDIYALVAVKPEVGDRRAATLREPTDIDEAVRMVARNMARVEEPSDKTLIRPPCPLAEVEGGAAARVFQKPVLAYASVGPKEVIRLASGADRVTYQVYGMDGRHIEDGDVEAEGVVDVRVPGAGSYVVKLGGGAVGFEHEGGACYEASKDRPCTIDEPGESPPFYFYVPKTCKSFTLKASSAVRGPPSKRPLLRLYALRLLVRDSSGEVVFERNQPLSDLLTFPIEVPQDQAGTVWSVVFAEMAPLEAEGPGQPDPDEPDDEIAKLLDKLEADGEGKGDVPAVELGLEGAYTDLEPMRQFGRYEPKSYVHFYFQDIPPVIANTPSHLLIAEGDE